MQVIILAKHESEFPVRRVPHQPGGGRRSELEPHADAVAAAAVDPSRGGSLPAEGSRITSFPDRERSDSGTVSGLRVVAGRPWFSQWGRFAVSKAAVRLRVPARTIGRWSAERQGGKR